MEIAGTRFGTIEFDEQGAIWMPDGLHGFASERRFIFLEPPSGGQVAWLQSITTPELAFPVLAADAFGAGYPDPSPRVLANEARILRTPSDEVAVLVVLAARRGAPRIANLLAPIVVNVDTRTAAQVLLDRDVYSAATLLEPAVQGQLCVRPWETREGAFSLGGFDA